MVGTEVRAKTAPELSDSIPYDPFPLDVYALGAHFHKVVLEVRWNPAQELSIDHIRKTLPVVFADIGRNPYKAIHITSSSVYPQIFLQIIHQFF